MAGSERDGHPVVRAFLRHRVRVCQHLVAHVREYDAFRTEVAGVTGDGVVVHVPRNRLRVEVALADQEIRVTADQSHLLGELSVAGVRDHLVSNLDAERGRVRTRGVARWTGRYHGAADRVRHADGELAIREGKLRGHPTHAGEQRLVDRLEPGLDVARSADGERAVAPRAEHRVEEHEGDAAAVIAVKMREEDRVDAVVRDTLLRERDQRRGTEIHGESKAGGIDQDAGLETAAAPERVTGADEPDSDRHG